MITPIIINRLKWKAYLIFMSTNLIFIPIIYLLYPETSNLALEEVDYIFARGGNHVSVARDMQHQLATKGHLDIEEQRPRGIAHQDAKLDRQMEKGQGIVEHAG